MKTFIQFLVVCSLIGFSTVAKAAEPEATPATAAPATAPAPEAEKMSNFKPRKSSLAGGLFYFSGDKTSSFSGTNGYFLENQSEFGNHTWYAVTAKARLTYDSGSVTFTDSGVQTYSFMYLGALGSLGLKLYGVTNEKAAIKPYLEGFGTFGVGMLKFSSTVNTLQPAGISIGYGYEIGGGIEFELHSNRGTYSDSLFVEFTYQSVTMNLAAKSAFQVGGFGVGVGYSW